MQGISRFKLQASSLGVLLPFSSSPHIIQFHRITAVQYSSILLDDFYILYSITISTDWLSKTWIHFSLWHSQMNPPKVRRRAWCSTVLYLYQQLLTQNDWTSAVFPRLHFLSSPATWPSLLIGYAHWRSSTDSKSRLFARGAVSSKVAQVHAHIPVALLLQ